MSHTKGRRLTVNRAPTYGRAQERNSISQPRLFKLTVPSIALYIATVLLVFLSLAVARW